MDNLKTDPNIAKILQKLKEADLQEPLYRDEASSDSEENNSSYKGSYTAVKNALATPIDDANDIPTYSDVSDNNFTSKCILPWFIPEDKDTALIHYLTVDDSNDIIEASIKADKPLDKIAALKLNKKYICDIEYYKSPHFVLAVKSFDHYYDNDISNIEVVDTEFTKSDDNSLPEINVNLYKNDQCSKIEDFCTGKETLYRYIIFTDLGIADFTTSTSCMFPYNTQDLNKWFEHVSNYDVIYDAEFIPHSECNLSSAVQDIKDYKYDIITMHRPGFITLDSSESVDSNAKLNLKVKEKYSFIPLNRLLMCIKNYPDSHKSLEDFKYFINKYFEIE